MLIAHLLVRDKCNAFYAQAIQQEYRFLVYGDAMLCEQKYGEPSAISC